MDFATVTPRKLLIAVCVFALPLTASADQKKPSINLRAAPVSGFAPLNAVLIVSITGGPNDYEPFYCPAIEWEWGDGTKSESKVDCDPYEPGKSEIVRAYKVDHRFNIGGDHRVQFRLKQKNKTVGSASVTIRVQGGMRDGYIDRSQSLVTSR